MAQMMGEDTTEVAPPVTNCLKNCQAENRVSGKAVVLGFPVTSRLTPPFP